MSKFKPYHVTDIQLYEAEETELEITSHFVVFWWNKIPLGHVWVTENELPVAPQTWKLLIWQAIGSAIQHYNACYEVLTDSELQSLKEEDFKNALPLLEKILCHLSVKNPVKDPVSIVICTRNRPVAIENCLRSFQNSRDRNFELIVVDNNPDDDQTRKVVEKFNFVSYVHEPRKGLDIARNTGARSAKYSIIAYTDDDVIIHEDWVSSLKQAFNDPLTMAVTGLVLPVELRTESQYIFEKYWGFNRGYKPVTFDHKYFLADPEYGPAVWDIGAGANMAFRREIFDLAGWFDERLDVGAAGCSGDSEFWYRILAEGWNCQYLPHIYVHHQHRDSLADLHHQIFSYMRGNVCSLLVQYEKYKHQGNLRRIKRALPEYYLKKLYGIVRHPGDQSNKTVWTEIRGCISGWRYYRRHKNEHTGQLPASNVSVEKPVEVSPTALVSVIIPCYNQGRYLKQAIESVRSQTYPHYEIIVVNDGSDDETADVCGEMKDLKYIYVHRTGASAARNIGVSHSKGQFLVFLDADDYLYPNALELHLYYFKYAPSSALVAGSYDSVDSEGNVLSTKLLKKSDGLYEALLQGNFIGIQSNVMYRKDLFFLFHFNTLLKGCEDYDLNLNITRQFSGLCYPEKITAYRIHDRNTSHNVAMMMESAVKTLNNQRKFKLSHSEKRALESGLANWKEFYGKPQIKI